MSLEDEVEQHKERERQHAQFLARSREIDPKVVQLIAEFRNALRRRGVEPLPVHQIEYIERGHYGPGDYWSREWFPPRWKATPTVLGYGWTFLEEEIRSYDGYVPRKRYYLMDEPLMLFEGSERKAQRDPETGYMPRGRFLEVEADMGLVWVIESRSTELMRKGMVEHLAAIDRGEEPPGG